MIYNTCSPPIATLHLLSRQLHSEEFLLPQLLVREPNKRLSLAQVLEHPWIKSHAIE